MRRRRGQWGPYTESEVEEELHESYRRDVSMKLAGLDERAIHWRGTMLDFEFWGHFVKLATGWYASFEDICPYCLHSIVLHHGTRDERRQWFAANETSEDRIDGRLYPMPITNRELARYKAVERRRHKQRKRAFMERWGCQLSRGGAGRHRRGQPRPLGIVSPEQEFIEI